MLKSDKGQRIYSLHDSMIIWLILLKPFNYYTHNFQTFMQEFRIQSSNNSILNEYIYIYACILLFEDSVKQISTRNCSDEMDLDDRFQE